MRAVWLPSLEKQELYRLSGDAFHHLVNVIRIKTGEELLLLDGKGFTVNTKVEKIEKKEMVLSYLDSQNHRRVHEYDIAIGIPKREALELCLKQATELGFRNIYLIRGEFSQMRIPESERLEKLLISALEQSNSAFLPELQESSWEDLPWENYNQKIIMDSQTKVDSLRKNENYQGPVLLIIGPEGGFSPDELIFIHARPGIEVLSLPTPIMRTPTALAAGAGVILQRLMDR